MKSANDLLVAYVSAHNAGVRTGDFSTLAPLLQPTASLRFRGVPVGPFDNAAAILEAFADQPPDDELVVLSVRTLGDRTAEAVYGWTESRGKSAGRLRITMQNDLISAIRVEVFG